MIYVIRRLNKMSLALILIIGIIVQTVALSLLMPPAFYWLVLNKEEREEYKLIIKNLMEKKK
jgi:hypothetical protein